MTASLVGALKSKLVWLGVIQIVYGLVEAYLSGTLTADSVTTAISGVLTILFRAVTDKPLSEK